VKRAMRWAMAKTMAMMTTATMRASIMAPTPR
jgi:hypothetical protein